MTVILWDFLSMYLDNVTRTPTQSRSTFTPLFVYFHGLSFFKKNLMHVVAVAGSPQVHFSGCVWKTLCSWHQLHHWLLQCFCSSTTIPEPWGNLCHTDILFKAENSTVSYSQLVDQLRVSMFFTACYKKSLLWWQLISGHSNMPLGLMLAASMWTWHTC